MFSYSRFNGKKITSKVKHCFQVISRLLRPPEQAFRRLYRRHIWTVVHVFISGLFMRFWSAFPPPPTTPNPNAANCMRMIYSVQRPDTALCARSSLNIKTLCAQVLVIIERFPHDKAAQAELPGSSLIERLCWRAGDHGSRSD